MASLGDHLNVYDTAIDVLMNKGFQVWFDKPANLYYAERDGWDFASRTPVGLLGLVAIFEATAPTSYVEYWWKSPKVRLTESLPSAPPRPYVPIYRQARERK